MNKYKLNAYLMICFLFGLAVPAQADFVELFSGQVVTGKIIEKNEEFVSIDTGLSKPLKYFIDEVKQVYEHKGNIQQANDLGQKGLLLIDEGKMDEGLEYIRQAIKVAPEDPSWYMNYGSIVFGNASSAFKGGNLDEGLQMSRRAEMNLEKALEYMDDQKDTIRKSQVHYMLGDMNRYIYQDEPTAVSHYRKSIDLFEHPGSLDALEEEN